MRNPHAVDSLPATAVAAYALLHLAAVQTFGPLGLPATLPPPAWRRTAPPRRAATMALVNHLRWELWGHAIGTAGLRQFLHKPHRRAKSPKLQLALAASLFYAQNG